MAQRRARYRSPSRQRVLHDAGECALWNGRMCSQASIWVLESRAGEPERCAAASTHARLRGACSLQGYIRRVARVGSTTVVRRPTARYGP